MADTKPVYKYTNGSWEKQNAYQYTNGQWVEISSNFVPPTPTSSLVYTLSSDGTYYIVGTGFTSIDSVKRDTSGGNSGSGLNSSWTGGDLVIPSTYNGKPVLAIAPKAFYNVNNIDSLYIYDGLTTIGHRAFQAYPTEYRLSTIELPDSINNFAPSEGRVFYGRGGLTTATFNCNVLDGNFYALFYGCSSLVNLHFQDFRISGVHGMSSMFSNCTSLVNADLSSFSTSNVTNTSSMFSGCSRLRTIDLSNLDTSHVTNMSNMFSGCSSLQRLDIRNFVFSNVSNYNAIFGNSGATYVPVNCLIIVKDNSAKTWVLTKRSQFTNVKTVAELGE